MVLKDLIKGKRDPVYYFFSGKGGVGKTSVAAATALKYSRENKKVLIISVDPAHSLSDSFQKEIGPEIKELAKNLYAVEIDPAKAVEEYKDKMAPQLEKMEALKGMGLEGMLDVAGMTPGIDEVAAFDKFLQYMHDDSFDIIIFDTAPTGHALRFLSLPDVLNSWVGKIIKIRMQFSGVIGMFKKILPFGDDEDGDSKMGMEYLDIMKKRVEEAKVLLTDPKRTHYNIVLIPEAMSILESERSLTVLDEYKIPVDTIVVNQIIPENSDCKFCTEKRSTQLERINTIKKKFSKFNIVQLNLMEHEVTGFEALDKVSKKMN